VAATYLLCLAVFDDKESFIAVVDPDADTDHH